MDLSFLNILFFVFIILMVPQNTRGADNGEIEGQTNDLIPSTLYSPPSISSSYSTATQYSTSATVQPTFSTNSNIIEYCLKIEEIHLYGAKTWDNYGPYAKHYLEMVIMETTSVKEEFEFTNETNDEIIININQTFCWINPNFTSLGIKIAMSNSHYMDDSYNCLTTTSTLFFDLNQTLNTQQQSSLTFPGSNSGTCTLDNIQIFYSNYANFVGNNTLLGQDGHDIVYNREAFSYPSQSSFPSHRSSTKSSNSMSVIMILAATVSGVIGAMILISILIWSYYAYSRRGYESIKPKRIILRNLDPFQDQKNCLNGIVTTNYSSFQLP